MDKLNKKAVSLTAMVLWVLGFAVAVICYVISFPILLFSYYPVGAILAALYGICSVSLTLCGFLIKGRAGKFLRGFLIGDLALSPLILSTLLVLIGTNVLHFPA